MAPKRISENFFSLSAFFMLVTVWSGKPHMVLVYLHDPNETYVNVLREIREQVEFSSIEVIVYRTLPDEKELEHVFRKSLSKA